MNKIAVIICVYKNDTFEQFNQMFESLEKQTLKNFDIFVQLDGKIKSDLYSYLDNLKNSSKIVYLGKREENKGFAYSLNELVNIVLESGQYKYIVRMDSDDICMIDRIEKQYKFMEKNPQIDVCGGWIEEFNIDDGSSQIIKYPEKNSEIIAHLAKRNPIAHVTTFLRADFFHKVGLYDKSKLNEDLDLWIRALAQGVLFYNIQEVLVKVRTSDDFFSRRKNFKRAVEVMQLKIIATKVFSFGIKGYIYAFLHFILFMSPSWLKSTIYKNLRG